MKSALPLSLALLALGAMASAQTLTATMTADNRFEALLSTSSVAPSAADFTAGAFLTGDDWNVTFSGSTVATPDATSYLYVTARNDEGVGGYRMFIGSFRLDGGFTFENGSSALDTDTTHWEVADLDAAGNLISGWSAPTTFGANTDGTTWGPRTGVADGASFLWSDESSNGAIGSVMFRTAITAPVPEPASLAALALGAGALIRRRRRS